MAFSGGTDSSFLLKIAHDVLGADVLALTADSPSQPRSEQAEAVAIATALGVRHVILPTPELEDSRYQANPPDRCYVCKGHILGILGAYARAHGITHLADGGNVDDIADYRPGALAVREHGVTSPLQEAGLTKAEIRRLSHEAGLPNWDRPSAACLASRIPYGTPITREILAQVEASESALAGLGYRQFRVRYHGPVARLEVPVAEFARCLDQREQILQALRQAGFTYVALDLMGFRSGSMNEALRHA